jgi:hypothetical protein
MSKSTVNTVAPLAVGFHNGISLALAFPISPDQALKLVSLDVQLSVNGVPGAAIINSMTVLSVSQGATAARSYGAPWANVPLGFSGVAFHVSDEEWYFWNDYTEQGTGGLTPAVLFSAQFDYDQTGAADTAFFEVTAVVELYEKQKLGLSGQQRINRDAQGNFIE